MNMQVREADLVVGEPAAARPPWWVHPLRRRAVLIAGALAVVAVGALLWVWYTTRCGYCREPYLTCATRCIPPITPERIELPRP